MGVVGGGTAVFVGGGGAGFASHPLFAQWVEAPVERCMAELQAGAASEEASAHVAAAR